MFVKAFLSAYFLALGANGWQLEFWSGQADCNYKIGDNGVKAAADTSRGGLDRESNNCMMMTYDPYGNGIMAMKVTGWTPDCAIALWSDTSGSPPCDSKMPYNPNGFPIPRKPDRVFTLKPDDLIPGSDGSQYVCKTPLSGYVTTGNGFLGYVSYSCGGNGTLLVEMDKNNLDPTQIRSLIESISTATTSATATTPDPTAPTRTVDTTSTTAAPTGDPILVTTIITSRRSTFTTVITKKGKTGTNRAIKTDTSVATTVDTKTATTVDTTAATAVDTAIATVTTIVMVTVAATDAP